MSDAYDRRSPVTGKSANPMDQPRYTGIASFMRTPVATTLQDLDIALVGVPTDGGVSHRPGARLGPREIRNQSSNMRRIHPVTRLDPYRLCNIADVGDVPFETLFDLAGIHREIEAFHRRLREAGVVPVTAGGDHSISYPILRAIAAEEPVGLIQIDAHTDTWDEFMGSKIHHGAPFRRSVEDGLIDPRRTVQIGIRGAQNVAECWDYSEQAGMRVLFMYEVASMGVEAVIDEVRSIVGDGGPLSFDVTPSTRPMPGDRHARDRRLDDAGSAAAALGPARSRLRGRRHRRSLAAPGSERHDGAGRRDRDVRRDLSPGRSGREALVMGALDGGLGRLDVLVNNAGVILEKPLLETSAADFAWVMDVNVRGQFLCGREALRRMAGRGGRVINMSSDLGFTGRESFSAYCASKGAIHAMTKSWAREFAPHVLVNAIAPGPIDTDMLDVQHMSPEWRRLEERLTALRRIGRPEEVAAVAVLLAGPGGSYLTGQILGPNGGSVMP